MKALVFDGKVVQIAAAEFPVASTLQWVDITGITPAPEVGWFYDGVIFSAPPRPSLNELKAEKREEFKSAGVWRVTAQVSEWDNFDRIALLASIWNMLGTPNAAQLLARDIYLYVKNTAIPRVNSAADEAALDAIDPSAADPFGDGTLWPT